MRRALALALAATAAFLAAPADAAPRGVTFTDPAGDANGLDGNAPAGSQAAFDVTRVRIAPHAPTKRQAGLTIRLDLAAVTNTMPGSSYVFTATQGACTITASRTWTTTGAGDSTLVTCGPVGGLSHRGYSVRPGAAGRSVTFVVPAEHLPDSGIGATLTGIEVRTAFGEPAVGLAAPAMVDRATYPKAYRIGS